MEADVLAAAQEVDFSLIALFWRATFIVKVVMVALFAASIWVWAIYIQKILQFRRARAENSAFDTAFWSGEPLDRLYAGLRDHPMTANERIFVSAMQEWERSHRGDGGMIPGTMARIERAMDVAIARERDRLSSGLTVLATTGSTGPFVGLFGTVWGIKHAFEEIAIQQNTNLVVVAPGIAEALLATALGLMAAIPAVVFFNQLNRTLDRVTSNYEAFADEFASIVSRQMDG